MIEFAYAATTSGNTPAAGGGMSSIVLIVLMVAIFYFMLIRPESKRKKQAEGAQSRYFAFRLGLQRSGDGTDTSTPRRHEPGQRFSQVL